MEDLVSTVQAARMMNCSDQFIRENIRKGSIPSIRVGKVYGIPREWIETHRDEFSTRPTVNGHAADRAMGYIEMARAVERMERMQVQIAELLTHMAREWGMLPESETEHESG